jgi:DNA-binding MarR family transcriptional regulator
MTISLFSARDEALLRHVLAVGGPTSPSTLEQVLHVSQPTINRAVRDLVAAGFLDKLGDGRSTRYVASEAARVALAASTPAPTPTGSSLLHCFSGRGRPCHWLNHFARRWELALR